jgi:hypothetical protein
VLLQRAVRVLSQFLHRIVTHRGAGNAVTIADYIAIGVLIVLGLVAVAAVFTRGKP